MSSAQKSFINNFEALKEARSNEIDSVPAVRSDALARLNEPALPAARDDDWRFVNIAPVLKQEFGIAPTGDEPESHEDIKTILTKCPIGSFTPHRMVFVNGRFSSTHSSVGSLPDGLTVSSLATSFAGGNCGAENALNHFGKYVPHSQPFASANTACTQDGAFIHVSKGSVISEMIQVLFITVAGSEVAVTHPRLLIVVEESASVEIMESYYGLGEGAYLTNPVLEIHGARNSNIGHYRFCYEGKDASHVSVQETHLESDTNFTSQTFNFRGGLCRNDIGMVLAGEGIDAQINALYVLTDDQEVDNHTRIEHTKPHCDSRELFKGVLGGHSHAVFNGLIHVLEDAQKTDSKQSNMHLLLSPDAQIDAQPQLEIYADDVKCTHGATIGQLDNEALFYLKARGINAIDAKTILTEAFAGDVISYIKNEELRNIVTKLTKKLLRQDGLVGK